MRRDAPRTGALLAGAVGVLCAGVLWRYAAAYPPTWPVLGTDASLVPSAVKLADAGVALAFLALLNLAAWWIGGRVRGWIGEGEEGAGADLTGPARIAYGLLVLPPAVLLLAGLHLLHPLSLAALVGVPAAAALPEAWRALRAPRATPAERPLAVYAVLGGLAFVLLTGPFLTALGPEVSWDADVYHLAIPERYLFGNGVELTPFSMFFAFPAAPEMLYLLALAVPSEAATKLLHMELGCLAFVLLWRVGRRESARCAWLAVVFLACEPLLYAEMGWALTDLFGAFYGLFATIAWLDWRRDGGGARLVRAGLFAGACLSARYLGGTVLLSLIALCWLTPRLGAPRDRLRATLVLGGVASGVLVPWLVRNALFTGNPIAPVLQGWFYEPGREFFSELAIAQTLAFDRQIGMGRDWLAYLALPWNLTVGTTPGTYRHSFGFQIGALHVVAALAGLGVAWWRRRLDMLLLVVQAWLIVTIWFLVFQEVRFLLPLAGTLAWLAAWSFDRLLRDAPAPAAWLLLAPMLALAGTWFAQLDGLGERYALALGGRPHEAVLLRDPVRVAARVMRRRLPPDGRVFLVGASRSYLFRGLRYVPYQALEGPPALDFIRSAPDAAALHCQLEAIGVTHVLMNENAIRHGPPEVPGYGRGAFAADMAKVRGLLDARGTPVHDRHGVRVEALGPTRGCEGSADSAPHAGVRP